ncbi:cupin domain-containing protein [Thermodesulfitimonas sp.]
MFVGHVREKEEVAVNLPGAAGVTKQSLIGPAESWAGADLRRATGTPGPHINYVVAGAGQLYFEGQEYQLEPGTIAYIPDGAEHQFLNTGTKALIFLCIVPEEGDK